MNVLNRDDVQRALDRIVSKTSWNVDAIIDEAERFAMENGYTDRDFAYEDGDAEYYFECVKPETYVYDEDGELDYGNDGSEYWLWLIRDKKTGRDIYRKSSPQYEEMFKDTRKASANKAQGVKADEKKEVFVYKAMDVNGNGVFKVFYDDGTYEILKGGKAYERSWGDYDKFVSMETLRHATAPPKGKARKASAQKVNAAQDGWAYYEDLTHEEQEIYLYAVNDGRLYENMTKPIMRNMARKINNGTYDKDKAVVAWEYLVKAAIEKYNKEFDDEQIRLSPASRKRVAQVMVDSYEENVNNMAQEMKSGRKNANRGVQRARRVVRRNADGWRKGVRYSVKINLGYQETYADRVQSDDTITVGELIKELSDYDDDMPVVMYSGKYYDTSWYSIEGVDQLFNEETDSWENFVQMKAYKKRDIDDVLYDGGDFDCIRVGELKERLSDYDKSDMVIVDGERYYYGIDSVELQEDYSQGYFEDDQDPNMLVDDGWEWGDYIDESVEGSARRKSGARRVAQKKVRAYADNDVDVADLAQFIKSAVRTLQTSDATNTRYILDENLAVYVGWSYNDAEAGEYGIPNDSGDAVIYAGVKLRNDADWYDYDWLDYPYDKETGDVWDNGSYIAPNEDYDYIARELSKAYQDILQEVASGHDLGYGVDDYDNRDDYDDYEYDEYED